MDYSIKPAKFVNICASSCASVWRSECTFNKTCIYRNKPGFSKYFADFLEFFQLIQLLSISVLENLSLIFTSFSPVFFGKFSQVFFGYLSSFFGYLSIIFFWGGQTLGYKLEKFLNCCVLYARATVPELTADT